MRERNKFSKDTGEVRRDDFCGEGDGALTTGTFESALVRHLPALYATALRLAGRREDAEDMVQESAMKAWEKRGQLRHPAALRSWLFTILVRHFYDRMRKKMREPSVVDVELDSVLSDRATQMEATIFDAVLDEEVDRALAGLNPDFRAVVWLIDVEEFPLRDAAAMLGCSVGTAASRLFRARAMLREELAAYAQHRNIGGGESR